MGFPSSKQSAAIKMTACPRLNANCPHRDRDFRNGSRPRENAEAKMAVRILFLSPRNLTLRHLQDFSALFCCILLKLQFAVLAVFYVIHSGLIEEKDSNDFSSVHVFTQPGSFAESLNVSICRQLCPRKRTQPERQKVRRDGQAQLRQLGRCEARP